MKLGKALIALAAMLGSANAAEAAVRYDFTAFSSVPAGSSGQTFTGSFSYTAPDFVTAGIVIRVASLDSCSVTSSLALPTICMDAGLFNDGIFYPDTVRIMFGMQNTEFNGFRFHYFAPNALTTPGTYYSGIFGRDQAGRLVVTNLDQGVPEPGTWMLMIVGFGLAGFGLRRRNAVMTRATA